MTILRAATAILLMLLSALHVYWACGGSWGSKNAVPARGDRPLFTPSKAATLAVAALLLMAGMIIFLRVRPPAAGMLEFISRCGAWTLAAVFTLRAIGDFHWIGFFKSVRGTEFGMLDTWIYSPLCLLLAIGSVVAAMNRGSDGVMKHRRRDVTCYVSKAGSLIHPIRETLWPSQWPSQNFCLAASRFRLRVCFRRP